MLFINWVPIFNCNFYLTCHLWQTIVHKEPRITIMKGRKAHLPQEDATIVLNGKISIWLIQSTGAFSWSCTSFKHKIWVCTNDLRISDFLTQTKHRQPFQEHGKTTMPWQPTAVLMLLSIPLLEEVRKSNLFSLWAKIVKSTLLSFLYFRFCEEMPKYVHNFISSIVQSSLYRMYDDEMGATPDGPSRYARVSFL